VIFCEVSKLYRDRTVKKKGVVGDKGSWLDRLCEDSSNVQEVTERVPGTCRKWGGCYLRDDHPHYIIGSFRQRVERG